MTSWVTGRGPHAFHLQAMVRVRGVAGVAALLVVAAALAGCGLVMTAPRQAIPTRTEAIPNLAAVPVPAGADALAALEKRPMRPPSLAAGVSCVDSSTSNPGAVAPNYGQGVGPLYLSGQEAWYETGQVAILIVDAKYSGPLLVRAFRLTGAGTTLSLVGESDPDPTGKEKQHGVNLVDAQVVSAGGLYIAPVPSTSYWRGWFAWLSADGPGCFGLQVDGDAFTEFVEFTVNAGSPPPG